MQQDNVIFGCLYTQTAQKVTNLPEIHGIHFLKEANFDLDLDAYFDESLMLFRQLHPEKEMLQNNQGKNAQDESSDDEAKVIDNLMSELTAD